MLGIAGVGFLTGAAYIGLRWWLARYDSLGRRKSFPWFAVGGLILLALAALIPYLLRMRLENRLSDASSRLVGFDVHVSCQGFGEAFVDAGFELGYVRFGPAGVPERETLIKREQCAHLSSFIGSDKDRVPTEQIIALHTLTHEAMHMSGITDEAQTECSAVQRDAEMARLLGAPAPAATELALRYWTEIYPRMPEGYRSDQCGPGREFDTDLPGAPWDR